MSKDNTMDDLKDTVERGLAHGKVRQVLMDHLISLTRHFNPDYGVEISIVLSHRDYKKNTAYVAAVSPNRAEVPLEDIVGAIQHLVDTKAGKETIHAKHSR